MSDKIKEIVAKNLAYYRKQNKITQKALAEQLGVKHNTISSWENGFSSIDIDTLFRVCQIFEISVNDMYEEDHEPRSPFLNQNDYTPSELEEIKSFAEYVRGKRDRQQTPPPEKSLTIKRYVA